MHKSSKRIRLEKEIFSKSIKDIERMFNFSYVDEEEKIHKLPTPSANFNRLDLPAGSVLRNTKFDYDCVNLSLMDTSENGENGDIEPVEPPILPSSSLIPGRMPTTEYLPRSVLFDLNDDDEVDDYKFELDLKLYRPRITLERDLKVIEQMFTRPFHLAH